jgi:hypothetical protein
MRKTIVALVGAATAATLISGAGLATASASPSRPAASGSEQFYLMTTQPAANRYVVIATGLFTAGGTDISGNTTDVIKLAGGSFKIHHGGKIHVVKQQFNPKTCLANFEATAAFTVGNGTGAYKGISGQGKAVVSSMFIARRNSKGKCNPNATPQFNEQTITAKAKIKL